MMIIVFIVLSQKLIKPEACWIQAGKVHHDVCSSYTYILEFRLWWVRLRQEVDQLRACPVINV
jgi:hypothetical protein